ncbi:hypothetical protein [Pedobacter sp. NJ-S-72]
MLVLQENISLKPYNTFGIDVKSRFFTEIFTEDDLVELRSHSVFKENKLLILGGGSNVLFTEDYQGLVLKISIPGITAEVSDSQVLLP